MGDTSKGRNRNRKGKRTHLRGSTVMKSGWTSLQINEFFSHAIQEKCSNEHKKNLYQNKGRFWEEKKMPFVLCQVIHNSSHLF
jgi:hypothetical protein